MTIAEVVARALATAAVVVSAAACAPVEVDSAVGCALAAVVASMVADVAAVAVAAVVVAADGGPTSRLSTTLSCSAISQTALRYYRFSYNGSDRAYVGVIAQEVNGDTAGGRS